MIPLVKPIFPSFEEIDKFYSKSLEVGLLSNWGPCFESLVNRLKMRTGMYTLPVATGTAAIQIAIQTHFNRGARIAIPDYTHVGTLQAVIAAGCIPVLFPVERHTWTLDLNAVHKDMRNLDGLIVVSPFGYGVNMEKYEDFAKAEKKILVYDFAGAWGMKVKTSHTVCYSLHATKNFSCGEGGLVLFNRKIDYQEAKRLSNFDTLPDRTVNSQYGNNLKMDELKCAIVLAHLDMENRILARINQKRALIQLYQDELREHCVPHNLYLGGAPSMCVLGGMKASLLESKASVQGFIAKTYYPLLSSMEGLEDVERHGSSGPFFETCLALPSDATFDDAAQVIQAVKRILKS
jgi:dTDP-4-amino-4,6-dideoxygalactose transaminase